MNKSLFLGMFAATGMLLATSCSNDELEVAQSGNEVQVSFALGLEGEIASRGISDGAKADKLVYAVYKKNAKTGEAELQNVVGSTNGQFVKNNFKSGDNVSVTLAKGQTYQVAFWAQDGDCNAYTTTDLKNVKVDYANAANNDELRDAFYKTVEFTVSGNKTIDVVLKRPFAQVNVGVYKSDWEAAVASGITIEKSSVIIKNAATSINLLTGAVGDETTDMEVNYTSALIPEEELKVDLNQDGDFDDENEKYAWLSMSYILVADHNEVVDESGLLGTDRTTLTGLEYTFTPAEGGNPITFKEGLSGAPVQRNWRTNILGKILTGDIQFNITIDPVYDGDYNYPENNENDNEATQQLQFVAAFGGTANLDGDADMTGQSLNVNGDAIFNMNGHTLISGAVNASYSVNVVEPVSVIFNESNINSLSGGIQAAYGANVTFNSGSISLNSATTSQRYNIYAASPGTIVTVNGGKFSFESGRKRSYACAVNGAVIYIKGGTFGVAPNHPNWKTPIYENGGEVIITGGTFGFDPSDWVADGYKAVKNGSKWYVVAAEIEKVATSASELSEALKNGEDVLLAGDVAVAKSEAGSNGYGVAGISQLKGGVIDGNGNAISVDAWGTWDSAINTTGGTIKNLSVTGGMRGIFISHNSTYSDKVVLENVTIDGTIYTISCDQGTNKGLEAYNSTFNGWTSYAATLGAVKFVDCSFGEGQGYAYCRPFAATEFVNCDFEAGYELEAQAAVTFENCTIDGVALTDDNLSTLVIGGINNATVK